MLTDQPSKERTELSLGAQGFKCSLTHRFAVDETARRPQSGMSWPASPEFPGCSCFRSSHDTPYPLVK
eukprot:scaffold111969_cov24-Prasinocladus_malaysianus.AAC.1